MHLNAFIPDLKKIQIDIRKSNEENVKAYGKNI